MAFSFIRAGHWVSMGMAGIDGGSLTRASSIFIGLLSFNRIPRPVTVMAADRVVFQA